MKLTMCRIKDDLLEFLSDLAACNDKKILKIRQLTVLNKSENYKLGRLPLL
jgi:hypothetical protein